MRPPSSRQSARAWGLAALICFAAAAPAQSPLYRRTGTRPQSMFASSLCALPDLDGDGIGDFAAAMIGDNQSGAFSGSVRVLSSASGAEILNLVGTAPGQLLGNCVAPAGDVDCDGVEDIIVGAPGASPRGMSSGEAIVFSGHDAHIIYRFPGHRAGEETGYAVGGAGDVDLDGWPDLIVASPGAHRKGWHSGTVRVYSGSDARILFTLHGREAGDRFGSAVAGPGDLDGDGRPEILVGAPQPNTTGPGYVRGFSGADAKIIYYFGGLQPGDGFGTSVASLGDLDGDAVSEILVGAFLADENGASCGGAQVFTGREGLPLRTYSGEASGDHFGVCVAAAGDLDGDGTNDYAVGAHQPYARAPGYVKLYSGASGEPIGTVLGSGWGDEFGVAIAGPGDVDGDGHGDLVIGAWKDGSLGIWTGSASAFSGAGLLAQPEGD